MKNICLTEEEIKAALTDYDGQVLMIREKISAINHELVRLSENIYEYLSWQERGEDAGARVKSGISDPVSRAVVRKEREFLVFRDEFSEALEELEDRLARMQMIRLAYLSLEESEYNVLRTLYEECTPWKAAAERLGISKRRLIKVRELAMEHIREKVERLHKKIAAAPDDPNAFLRPAALPGEEQSVSRVAEPGILYGK